MMPVFLLLIGLLAQQPATAPAPAAEMNALEKAVQESLTNASRVGYFTGGDSNATTPDTDTIESLTKIDATTWKIDARIQYGGKDYRASVNIPVLWAGETPVLSMAQYAIPGQGVYSARILIHNGMYAGTWGSPGKGGKMFGMVVKNTPDAAPQR